MRRLKALLPLLVESTMRTTSRRQFLRTSLAASGAWIAAPAVHTLAKSEGQPLVLGQDAYRYEVQHAFPQLPDRYSWQTTHNVAVDAAQNLYVIHEGKAQWKDHPAIFVFDADGKFLRAFGSEFQGGGHGLEVRREGSEEFLYVCGYQQVKSFAKLTLKGDVVWWRNAPMESGVYRAGEDRVKKADWGQDRFMPTNFAFTDDGGFLLADGYGSFYIHRFDAEGIWLAHLVVRARAKESSRHRMASGLIDARRTSRASLSVTGRTTRCRFSTCTGSIWETRTGFGLPANLDTWQDLMLVPELHARVSLLDKDYNVVAQLGEDVARVTGTKGVRNDAKQWQDGKFVHPHDACFNERGDIFVAEWVSTGRVSRLKRLS